MIRRGREKIVSLATSILSQNRSCRQDGIDDSVNGAAMPCAVHPHQRVA
jgi:hypothetical protein